MKKLICIVCLMLVPVTGYSGILDEVDVAGYAKMKAWKLTNYMKSEFSPHCIHLDENREAAWVVMLCPYFPVIENYNLGSKKPPETLFNFPHGVSMRQPRLFGFPTPTQSPDAGLDAGCEEMEGDGVCTMPDDIRWYTAEYAVPRMPRENVPNPQHDPTKPMLAMVQVRLVQKGRKVLLHAGLANLRDVEVGKALARGEDVEGATWLRDTLMLSEFDAKRFNNGNWITMNSPFLQRGLLDGIVVKIGGLPLSGGRTAAEQAELAKSAGWNLVLTILGVILGWLGCFLLLMEGAKRLFQTRHPRKIWYILAVFVAVLLVAFLNLLALVIVSWGLIMLNWGFLKQRHRSNHPAHP